MTTWKMDIPEVTDEEDLVRHKEDRIRLRAANLGLERRLARARELLQKSRELFYAQAGLDREIQGFLDGTDEGLRWSDVKLAAREP